MKIPITFFHLFALLPLIRYTTAEVGPKRAFEDRISAGYHLISLSPDAEPVWKTDEETDRLIADHTRFFDITDVYDPSVGFVFPLTTSTAAVYPPPSHQAEVAPLLENVSLPTMQSYLNSLTSFNNRYYRSTSGQEASIWIRDTIFNITLANPASGATVALFNHSWLQSSIIARFPGKTAGPVTILGAHMDSVNSGNPTNGRSPGADDDGSGSVNLIEAFRVLAASGFQPSTTVEFHWYAAEEGGLRGSQDIATNYKNAGVQVKGMVQLDMTAYVKPGTKPVVALMPDYTDSGLTNFIGSLVDSYTTLNWVINEPCGYACSDHASWNRHGYPAALPFESLFKNLNPTIHSASDSTAVNGFLWNHTFEYTKICVAYAYELGI